MENNNSKQVLFSIIGIAILIVAVVGVSFAFFSYQRTGSTNNYITTGKITFNFDHPDKNPSGKLDPTTGKPQSGTPLVQTEAEPKSDEDGEKTPETDKYGFGIDAELPEGVEDIKYAVYVVSGDKPSGKHPLAVTSADGTKELEGAATEYNKTEDLLDHKYISIMVEEDDRSKDETTTPTNTGTIVTKFAKSGGQENQYKLTDDPATGQGVMIASGTLKKGTHTIDTYKISMWINEDLTISDTDGDAAYRASRTSTNLLPEGKNLVDKLDDRKVYSDMYYSLKIKIVAGDQVGIGG